LKIVPVFYLRNQYTNLDKKDKAVFQFLLNCEEDPIKEIFTVKELVRYMSQEGLTQRALSKKFNLNYKCLSHWICYERAIPFKHQVSFYLKIYKGWG